MLIWFIYQSIFSEDFFDPWYSAVDVLVSHVQTEVKLLRIVGVDNAVIEVIFCWFEYVHDPALDFSSVLGVGQVLNGPPSQLVDRLNLI